MAATNRPEVLDKGSMVIGGYTARSLMQAVDVAIKAFKNSNIIPVDYHDDNVSIKVVKIIQSYADIINKVIWNKT
jgi:UDP-N-acetylglucosamine 2-epimerase (non-hydrolysing)